MNADDTRLLDNDEMFSKKKNKKADNSKIYGAAAGAATVGVAAGVGAHAAYGASLDREQDEDIDLEGAELAEGASAVHSQVSNEPQHTVPQSVQTPVSPAADQTPASEPVPQEIEETIEPLVQDPEESEPAVSASVGENTVQTNEPPVNPDEDLENPDVDEILSGEQIDALDIEAEEVFAFDNIDTVYTVDGEELTAASFHLDNGFEGVMIDVDGDGVFDDVAAMTADGLVRVGDAPTLTVDDVELELQPNDSYLAQNDDTDHTLADDSFADDIIDVTLA